MRRPPVLTVQRDGVLQLDFPGWNPEQVNESRKNLICWFLKRGHPTTLLSEPLALAQWEAKETYPDLIVSDFDRLLLRSLITTKKEVKLDDWTYIDLYPIQREPAAKLHDRKRALLTAAPGLGKTIISLCALRNLTVPLVVVVVPLTSFDGWKEELEKWYFPHLDGMLKAHFWREYAEVSPLQERSDGWTEIVLTTPNVINGISEKAESLFGSGLQAVFYDASEIDSVLILDESFMYQNRKAGRTNVIEELSYNFDTIWMLSGMPVSKISDDLFSQLKILYPTSFRSYWKFVARYCILEENHWGTSILGDKPDAVEKLKRDLIDIVISCDYPENIPGWTPIEIDCPMTAEQEEIYLDAKHGLILNAAKLRSDKPLSIKTVLSLTSRLMQISSNPITIPDTFTDTSGKWEKLLESLPEYGLPALVWVKYKATAKLLRERIAERYPAYRIGVLTGSTKPADRYALVENFQNHKLDILILNDVVGKYSLTLTEAVAAHYLERDFNGEAYYQSLYRARRITSKHSVKIILYRSTYRNGGQTIDQVVHDALLQRSQNAQKFTIGQLVGSI